MGGVLVERQVSAELGRSGRVAVGKLIEHAPLREREWAIEEMLVKQPDDVRIESVETPDSLDQILITFHVHIIPKLLDKVK